MKKYSPLQIMFLGTGSDVGKSVIAGGFCRILYKQGYKVAPFKAQNMALNSFVTMDGREMGRAQVFQAMAAGIPPESDMNPVLLKPSGSSSSQIIVQGKVFGDATSINYYNMIEQIFPRVLESYSRLKEKYNALVLEGAGSTAEINLKKSDFVNIQMAKTVQAPAVIIADIDRGGVFASLIGTMNLLTRKEKKLIIGFIINKFRGDKTLLEDGIKFIERKTKRPVFGVVPYFQDIHLPEEDSVALQRGKKGSIKDNEEVRIAVIHLPFISNYTDFDPFEAEEKVSLIYARQPDEIVKSSVVIIPGTKNTIEDLIWMEKNGFVRALKKHVKEGKTLIGICGGYQMLGNSIKDPYGVESKHKKIRGLSFLNIDTVLEKEKKLIRIQGKCRISGINSMDNGDITVEGYEIHMGTSRKISSLKPCFTITLRNAVPENYNDGSISEDEKVWGTYIHGLFENDDFRTLFLAVHGRKASRIFRYRSYLETHFDKLTSLIEENVDVQRIINIAKSFC